MSDLIELMSEALETAKQLVITRGRIGNLEAENERLRAALDRLLVAGNHIATYRTERWPDYALNGLTREQQCEHALRTLGAGRDYDMWCCWSAMMQARDEYDQP